MSYLVADKRYIAGNAASAVLGTSIEDYPEGIIIPIDKPYRWTSADVIRKVKYAACRHFGKKKLKVGHAGTLDPLATGVLLVCIGPATRQAETLQKHDKEYLAGITFGATTPSYDLEKEIDKKYPYDQVNEERVREALKSFIGPQEQIAPLFSAKSIDGVRAYELARKLYRKSVSEGNDFDHSEAEILSRQNIIIHEAELVSYNQMGITRPETVTDDNPKNNRIHVCDYSDLHLPHADIRIACTKGTYIRAFARDLGEALDTGAHLDALCRTRTGDFSVENALQIDEALAILEFHKTINTD